MFDIEVLNDLQQLLEDGFVELIEVYLRDINTKVPELERLTAAQDLDNLAKVAHSLKGASINLGIGSFGEQCGLIEQAARNQSTEDLSELVPQAVEQSIYIVKELTAMFLK